MSERHVGPEEENAVDRNAVLGCQAWIGPGGSDPAHPNLHAGGFALRIRDVEAGCDRGQPLHVADPRSCDLLGCIGRYGDGDRQCALRPARGGHDDIAALACVYVRCGGITGRSEEHTSELQSLMRTSYAVFCLKKKNAHTDHSSVYALIYMNCGISIIILENHKNNNT